MNLELHKGEFVYLVGKVGSGKTSLLKTFYGELDIASGEAEVLGCQIFAVGRVHEDEVKAFGRLAFEKAQHMSLS